MSEEFNFKEPHKGLEVSLRFVPTKELEVIGHQRKARPAHIEHLVSSVERIGFIVPLVAVEEERNGETRYVVIDGQHRLQAAQKVGIDDLPVIVVPQELAPQMMNLNVEKDLNIREKSFVSLGIYRSFLESDPDMNENEGEVADSIEHAYFVTLGIAYDKASRLPGSAFEPLLKKCDFFLEEPLSSSYEIREGRADMVLETSSLVKDVTEKAKESGVWHQYFQNQLLSYVDPYKRKRGPLDFDDVFTKVNGKLKQLAEEPDKLSKLGGS